MAKYDYTYIELVEKILEDGVMDNSEFVRGRYEDGQPAPAISLPNQQIKIDSEKEVPRLSTKFVPEKDPFKELRWIWQLMSNDVTVLQEMGCKVWDEWKRPDSTIGKAYGWQLKNKKRTIIMDELFVQMFRNNEFSIRMKDTEEEWSESDYDALLQEIKDGSEHAIKLNQVDYLLYQLKKNPYSRQIKTTLWCVEDLDDMALPPCVYETHWFMFDGRLNLTVNIRSNDIALGNPYNVYQYFLLHHMIAQVSNLKVGELCFNLDIPHIYDRHIDSLKEQIKKPVHDEPNLYINKDITSFYDFTIDDIKVLNYEHSGKIKYEVAI